MRRHVVILVLLVLAGAVVNVAVAWGLALCAGVPPVATKRGTLSEASVTRWDLMWWEGVGATRIEWEPVRIDGISDQSPAGRESINKMLRWYSDGIVRIQIRVTGQSEARAPEYEVGPTLAPTWGRMRTESVRSYGKPRHAFSRDPDGPYMRHFEDARGWPCLSLWAGVTVSKKKGKPPILIDLRYAVAGWGDEFEQTTLPLPDLRLLPYGPIWPGFVVNTLCYAAILWLLICGLFALRRQLRRRRGLCPACAYPIGDAALCTECGKPLPGREAPA